MTALVDLTERALKLCNNLYGLLALVDKEQQDNEWCATYRALRREFWELSSDVAAHNDQLKTASIARHPHTKRER